MHALGLPIGPWAWMDLRQLKQAICSPSSRMHQTIKKYSLVQWNWFSVVTRCTWVSCINDVREPISLHQAVVYITYIEFQTNECVSDDKETRLIQNRVQYWRWIWSRSSNRLGNNNNCTRFCIDLLLVSFVIWDALVGLKFNKVCNHESAQ